MLGELLSASKAYADFKKDLRADKISHAYLFLGEDALARREYMRLFASTILCSRGGCGECEVCDKIYNDCHLGVNYFNENGKMTVKEAETLIEESYKSSWETSTPSSEEKSSGAGKKIYFIVKILLLYEIIFSLINLYISLETEGRGNDKILASSAIDFILICPFFFCSLLK